MKKSKIITVLILLLISILTSCDKPGTTQQSLTGSETTLPPELKGLKVYKVITDDGNYVKVAVLNNNINSLTYPVGKSSNTTIMVNNKSITIKEILLENDSIIVCRK